MGEAKQRREMGVPPRTVHLPPLTREEVHALHHLLHHRLHELEAAPPEERSEALQEELRALTELHRKLFAH